MNTPIFDTLVISGGSVKGFIALGSLQYLNDNNYLQMIHTYIGTSVGSIIGYLLAIGYTPIEIIVYICTHQVLERMRPFNLVAMLNGSGATSFNIIQEHLEIMTIEKIGKLITLNDLFVRFNKRLICVTYNLTTNMTEYLDYVNNPDLPCITALKLSSNLPFIFDKFKYNGNFYIDGGIYDNFPIDIGDSMSQNKVLGINLSLGNQKFGDPEELNMLEYFYTLTCVPISQITEYKIKRASSKCVIITLVYDKIKFFRFDISSNVKLEMFSFGYTETQMYIQSLPV